MEINKKTATGILLLIYAIDLFVGLRGVDFGYHWDEEKIQRSLAQAVETGVPIPGWYNYPSLLFDISYGYIWGFETLFSKDPIITVSNLTTWLEAGLFNLQLRGAALAITYLSVFWVYWLIVRWRGKRLEGVIGAAVLGTSWELSYHARWVAPDTLVMVFAVLAMALMARALMTPGKEKLFLGVAAVAAGLCTGAKYPGAVLILPIMVSLFLILARKEGKVKPDKFLLWFVLLSLIVVLTFVLSTPGIFLETDVFIEHVVREWLHYSQIGHRGHTIESPIEYFRLLLPYLGLTVFSHYWPLALLIISLSIYGAVDLVRSEPKLALWFLIAPVVYTIFFAFQKVLIVRNFLILLPFLAVLAARGFSKLFETLPEERWRRISLAVLLAVVLINLGWMYTTANSIYLRDTFDRRADLISYLESHQYLKIYLTPPAQNLLGLDQLSHFDNIVEKMYQADIIVMLGSNNDTPTCVLSDRRGLYELISGPTVVNIDYYPTWQDKSFVLASDLNMLRFLGKMDCIEDK